MLVARDANKEEFSFHCYSVVDGKPVNLDGLADRLRAAQLGLDAQAGTASSPAPEGGQDFSGERLTDCLEERMRRAEERLAWA